MRFDFTNLRPGEMRSGAACLLSRQERTTRRGDPYLVLELGNSSGRAAARVWSEHVPHWEGLDAGAAVQLNAKVIEGWQGRPPELEVDRVLPLPEDHPIRLEVNPLSSVPREELERRFDALVDSIERPEPKVLVDVVMEHEHNGRPLRQMYFEAPAAMKHHHATISGLAEHSIEVAELAVRMASVGPYVHQLDRDVIIAGALLHDLGKVDEYQFGRGRPIATSGFGRLRSHLCRGSELVALAVADSYALPAGVLTLETVTAVQHIIESHHAEYGSVVQPQCMEAMIVHIADLCSARLRTMLDTIEAGTLDAEHWAPRRGWKQDPVWHLLSALDQSEVGKRNEHAPVPDIPAPAARVGPAECATYFFPRNGS